MFLKKRFKTFYERFISLKGEPREIAAGFAIGVFVGVTPTIPFHTAIIVMICLLFRKNITAACLGSWIISNPLTVPLFYLSQYELGRILLGVERCQFILNDYYLKAIASLGWQILLPLLTGGLVMAPFFAVPAYFMTCRLVEGIRARGQK
jgi:uncharacterized protein (DUF2062 family)